MNEQPKRRRGRPLASERVVTREQILDAGLKAFATHGYDAMSVRALSLELGGSPHLVRHYYASKQALWEACIDGVVDKVRAAIQNQLAEIAEAGTVSPDVARQTLEAAIRIGAHNPDLVRIALDEGRQGGARLDYLFDQGFGPNHQILMRTLSKLGGEDTAIEIEEQNSLFFIGTVGGAAPFFAGALAEKFGGADKSNEEAMERHIRLVTDMVFDRWMCAAQKK